MFPCIAYILNEMSPPHHTNLSFSFFCHYHFLSWCNRLGNLIWYTFQRHFCMVGSLQGSWIVGDIWPVVLYHGAIELGTDLKQLTKRYVLKRSVNMTAPSKPIASKAFQHFALLQSNDLCRGSFSLSSICNTISALLLEESRYDYRRKVSKHFQQLCRP